MLTLSLDTSNAIASIAVLKDDILLGEKFSEDQKTHSEKVLPMVDELLHELNLDISDMDRFCICTGPGSFTGIRIGVSLIKGMAQALNKRVIGITALLGLIYRADADNVCAIIDAKHDNVYAQYKIGNKYSIPDCRNIYELISELKNNKESFLFVGSGVKEYKDLLSKELKCDFNDNLVIQRASDLAIYAYTNNIEEAKPQEIIPVYLRKAQPER
jgi:tRNA threonylcarbamoyladenosine biosynthesis protein TsaB